MFFIEKFNYFIYIALMMLGIYGMISKKNLMKKLISMNIFQTSIMLFFISIGYKQGATIPIITEGLQTASAYINPLPHVLILTAIVVSVGTTGVAIAILIALFKKVGSLEEDEILEDLQNR
jgi:multicomponent Na+:H+ antiporter subunit C